MLAAKGLFTVADLLYYAPFRYEDRRNIKAIAELAPGEKAVVLARVSHARLSGFRRGGRLFEAAFEDGSGARLVGRWYRGEHYAETLVPDVRVALFGKVELERAQGSRLMVQPETEILPPDEDADASLHTGRIVAVYEAASKISTRVFRALLHRILEDCPMPDDALPESVRQQLALPTLDEALRELHAPGPDADLRVLNDFRTPGQVRLIFEEFFWLECGLAFKKRKAKAAEGISFPLDERIREQVKKMLPFKPTSAQRRVMQEIADDMKRPHPMNRLLQGDVGSGKTIVAAQAAVIAIENKHQVSVLAPTEILARQHYAYFKRLLEKLGYVVALLTGSASPREKEQIKNLISHGLVQVVVGTHAVIQEDVSFANLGLAIVDENIASAFGSAWS
jgi:ATP-dependent DNA helicase RecG